MTVVLITIAFLYLVAVGFQLALDKKVQPAEHSFNLAAMRRESRPLPRAEPRPATLLGFLESVGDQITLGRILIGVGFVGALGAAAVVVAAFFHFLG